MSTPNALSRRAFLTGSTALALTGCASVPDRDATVVGELPLKERAARKGIRVGAAVDPRLLTDPDYAAALIRDVDMLVPENALKWGPLERRHNVLDFRGADAIADFAVTHDMALRGHTLLWHNMLPDWLPGQLASTRNDPADILTDHIRRIVSRYRGRMHSWDVINEALEPSHGRFDGLRKSLFLNALGPDYIALAFRAAADADPGARLVLNDYGYEWGWDVGQQRRRTTLRLLEDLLGKGVPIHAVGIQGHLDPGSVGAMDMPALGRFCDAVSDLGLEIQVTELDARDISINGSIGARDRAVADAYARFLDVVLARKATKAVLTWGITDRHSWLTNFFPRSDGDTVRGLPYDTDYKHKPAWYAMAAALDAAPTRAPNPSA